MTIKEFEQFDKDSVVNKIKDILAEIGGSDSLILSLVPLDEPHATGTICEIPSPDSMYLLIKLITRMFIINGHKEMISAMTSGIMDGLQCEMGIESDESSVMTESDADRIVQDYISKNFGKNHPKS